MEFSEYASIDAVNISSLVTLAKSPLHYKYAIDSGSADSPAMRLGRLAHLAILEPERYADETAVYSGKIRRGKAYDAFLETLGPGKRDVTVEDDRRCQAMAAAIRSHQVASKFLGDQRRGLAEHVLLWTHAPTAIKCKSRLDWVDLDTDTIVDLKTTLDASELDFGRSAARYRYHTRAAFYADAYRARYGKAPTFILVVVEKSPPYAVAVYRIGDMALAQGRREYERLLGILGTCRKTNTWPGIGGDSICDLVLPEWVYNDTADEGLDDIGFEQEGDGSHVF